MSDVKYPDAWMVDPLTGHCQETNISNATRDAKYECYGGPHELRPVLPKTNIEPHFRHKPNVDCDPDRVLHITAQRRLKYGVEQARDEGRPYWLRVPCLNLGMTRIRSEMGKKSEVWGCTGFVLDINVAVPGVVVVLEDTALLRPYRPDVTIRLPDRILICEIEVTSLMEGKAGALAAYQESDYPVLRRQFTDFADLEGLNKEFVADRASNVPKQCPACEERQKAEGQNFSATPKRGDTARAELSGQPVPNPKNYPNYVPQLQDKKVTSKQVMAHLRDYVRKEYGEHSI